LEAIKLNDARIPLQDLDLEAFRRSTPLRTADVALVEGKRLAATCRLPSKTCLGKPTLAAFLRQVQIDVIETLTVAHFYQLRSKNTVSKSSENNKKVHNIELLLTLLPC